MTYVSDYFLGYFSPYLINQHTFHPTPYQSKEYTMKNTKPAVYYVAVRNCRNTPYGIFHKDDLRLTDATVQEKYGPFNRDQAREFKIPGRYVVTRRYDGKETGFDSENAAFLHHLLVNGPEKACWIWDRVLLKYVD